MGEMFALYSWRSFWRETHFNECLTKKPFKGMIIFDKNIFSYCLYKETLARW